MRETIEELQQRSNRAIGGLDERLREAREIKGRWDENDIEYWLHPFLHSLTGALASLSERIANLEELLIRLAEAPPEERAKVRHTAYLTSHDRSELEVAAMSLKAEDHFIREQFMDLERPVAPHDRANTGMLIMRLRDQVLALSNEFRATAFPTA